MKAIDDAVRADAGVKTLVFGIAAHPDLGDLSERLWLLAEIAGHAGAIAALKDSIAGMSK